MSRGLAYGFGLGLCLLVASPALKHPRDDSYPLSTYPMFAQKRDRPLFYFVEGVDKRRRRTRLPPELVANAEVMQAASRVRRAVNAGPEAMVRFCNEVASRVAASKEQRRIVELAIVGARYDPIAYFTVGPDPVERTVQHTCKVTR